MKKILLSILPLFFLEASFASETISTTDKYNGVTENGKECRLEMESHTGSELVTGRLFVRNRLKIEIENEIRDSVLVESGRHNLECADNGSFCFWPFETADKILALNFDGDGDISSVSYITETIEWTYGEQSSYESYAKLAEVKCLNLVNVSSSNE